MTALTVGGRRTPENDVSRGSIRTRSPVGLPARASGARLVTWELPRIFSRSDFRRRLDSGQRNVFTTTIDLTGIAFLTEPRHLSPLVSRLRVETSARTDAEWDMDYDFQHNRVNASTLLHNYHIGQVTVGGDMPSWRYPAKR